MSGLYHIISIDLQAKMPRRHRAGSGRGTCVTLVPRHRPGPRPYPSEDALGERRDLQSNVRNRNDLPERGLTHRADCEKPPRRPPITIENRAVGGGLAVTLGELSQRCRDAQVIRPCLMVIEGQPHELVAKHVVTVTVPGSEARTAQASQRAGAPWVSNSRQHASCLPARCFRLCASSARIPEHTIRPDKMGLAIQQHRSTYSI